METKVNLDEKTIQQVKNLIRTNIDSSDGLHHVAGLTDNPSMRTLYTDLAEQRRENATELQNVINMNNEEVENCGSTKAKMHRWWIDFREKISSDEEYTLLAEAEKGEDVIKAHYEEVLKETAGSPLNDMLQKQYAEVKAGHDRIRDLRDQRKAA